MKTVVITYKGVLIKEPNQPSGKRAVEGDVVTLSDADATLLIGMGRAKPYESPKDTPKPDPEKEPVKETKREAFSASPKPDRKKE